MSCDACWGLPVGHTCTDGGFATMEALRAEIAALEIQRAHARVCLAWIAEVSEDMLKNKRGHLKVIIEKAKEGLAHLGEKS